VSGDLEALSEFEAELSARRVMRWRIPETDFVAHSPRVAELAPVLAGELAGVRPAEGEVPFFSTVHCRWMDGTNLDAGYWYANVRQPVRFDEAIRTLAEAGYYTYIEVSPHPVLEAGIADTIEDTGVAAVPVISGTLHRESSGARQFVTVLARLHARGVTADWAAVLVQGQCVPLPTYAFQHERFWPRPVDVAAWLAAAAGGDGTGLAAEARFWAAVEGGDVQALSRALAVDGQQPLSEVLPALASWRRRERDRSVTGSWRYQVAWLPVPDPEPAGLSGTWLLVTPAGSASEALAQGCAQALIAHGAQVIVAETSVEADRTVLAARIGQALAGVDDVSGVLSLLGVVESPLPGFAGVPVGLAATLALVQGLGDARVDAPLWLVTQGGVAAGAGEVLGSAVQSMVWGLGRVAGG
jgi:acyl transferase domain-containing protein